MVLVLLVLVEVALLSSLLLVLQLVRQVLLLVVLVLRVGVWRALVVVLVEVVLGCPAHASSTARG